MCSWICGFPGVKGMCSRWAMQADTKAVGPLVNPPNQRTMSGIWLQAWILQSVCACYIGLFVVTQGLNDEWPRLNASECVNYRIKLRVTEISCNYLPTESRLFKVMLSWLTRSFWKGAAVVMEKSKCLIQCERPYSRYEAIVQNPRKGKHQKWGWFCFPLVLSVHLFYSVQNALFILYMLPGNMLVCGKSAPLLVH